MGRFFFFQAEDGIRDSSVTGVQTCALPISEYFIDGTQPVETCQLHGGGGTQVASWDTSQPPVRQITPSGGRVAQGSSSQPARATGEVPIAGPDAAPPAQDPNKKKNLRYKIMGI